MKPTIFLPITAFLTNVLCQRVVKYDIDGSHPSHILSRALERPRNGKRGTINQTIANTEKHYNINITLGTPPQQFSLQLDTGSSDLWVLEQGNSFCQESGSDCQGGYYDESRSSSSQILARNGFKIAYGDNTQATGDLVTDVLQVGGVNISNQTFGVGRTTTINRGVMGIGLNISEASCVLQNYQDCGNLYPNVIDQMVMSGVIPSRAYSLWLNDLNASTGSILFSGVDPSRYVGELVGLPIIPNPQNGLFTDFSVAWTNFTLSTPDGNVSSLWPGDNVYRANLDSGTSLGLWPTEVADSMYSLLGAEYISDFDFWIADCDLRTSNVTVNFSFGGPTGTTIGVPLRELLIELLTTDGQIQTTKFSNGDRVCQVGFSPSPSGQILLGDTFLRSAYVVYDLDNRQIALAQTNFQPGNSNVQEFSNVANSAIPQVSSVATEFNSVSQTQISNAPTSAATLITITDSSNALTTASAALAAFTTAAYTGQGSFSDTQGSGSNSGAQSGAMTMFSMLSSIGRTMILSILFTVTNAWFLFG